TTDEDQRRALRTPRIMHAIVPFLTSPLEEVKTHSPPPPSPPSTVLTPAPAPAPAPALPPGATQHVNPVQRAEELVASGSHMTMTRAIFGALAATGRGGEDGHQQTFLQARPSTSALSVHIAARMLLGRLLWTNQPGGGAGAGTGGSGAGVSSFTWAGGDVRAPPPGGGEAQLQGRGAEPQCFRLECDAEGGGGGAGASLQAGTGSRTG
ncbi:unnamed protein product, partial [Discosporangium mesarthrocarpum]